MSKFVVGRKQYEKALGSPVELGLLVEGVDYTREEKEGVERVLFSEEALLKVRRENLNKILGIKGKDTQVEVSDISGTSNEAEVVIETERPVIETDLAKVEAIYPNQRFVGTDKGVIRTGKFANKLRRGMLLKVRNNIVVGMR